MSVRRSIALLGLLLVPGVVLPGATSAADQDTLIKYYRKKNNVPPSETVTVKDVKDSPIKGAKQGVLEIGTPPRARQVPFTASSDFRYVIFAEVDDVTVDPAKAVMDKVSLKNEVCRGPKDAKVTIIEYSDFQCPFCAKGYNTIENEVLTEYKDKVRFCYKHLPLPFHPWAEPSAIAMECMKQQNPDAAWAVYRGFFEKQKEVTPANVKEKALEFAANDKIDKAKFEECFDKKETLDKVKADKAEATSLGLTGTPSFVINGRMVKGAQPAANFKAIIDDELASAK
ncbi:MAG TPA: thioredoxin domain-containing protein [Candidatus Binatia bacterium]